MINEIDNDALAALCPELRMILDAEIAAGNEVADVSRGWGQSGSVHVALRLPFRSKRLDLPAGVIYRAINDPHWWKAEYEHESTGHLLVCRF